MRHVPIYLIGFEYHHRCYSTSTCGYLQYPVLCHLPSSYSTSRCHLISPPISERPTRWFPFPIVQHALLDDRFLIGVRRHFVDGWVDDICHASCDFCLVHGSLAPHPLRRRPNVEIAHRQNIQMSGPLTSPSMTSLFIVSPLQWRYHILALPC